MVSDLYVFDLETCVWERLPAYPEDDVPRARYFHSADAWNNQLVVFGGMSNQPDSANPDELCVLNDVRFFDLASRHWLPASHISSPSSDPLVPRARYAHLSSITGDRLFIIGGQDFYNTWLDDVCVYDLLGKAWVLRRDYPRHCGTYRSVAVSSNLLTALGPSGAHFREDQSTADNAEITAPETLSHLPYSAAPTEDHPADIFLYSNYNFTDVKRELEVFSPLPDTDFTIEDRSATMAGTTFPPGLRFPTGAILGTHLIIAGTYLAHSYQSFSIWVLDLITMTWSRIDPGKAVETGSWFRGCLWADANKFLVFGNRNGNLVDDYNRRLLSWDHVAIVDLEAFGIYQPPPLRLDLDMQELGLAALEEKVLADFEISCDDGRKIACSRRILEDRWPWFKEQRQKLLKSAMAAMESLPSTPMHIPLPDLPGSTNDQRPDPRLTPRAFFLSEPYPITLALLQYFYSMSIITPLQHAPAVLSQLLVLATNYQITHLETLVRHAMHRALSNSTSVGVYEVATLCSCRSLQIRALKTVMSYTQKRPSKSRNDKDGSGGGRPPDVGGGGGGPSNGSGGPPNNDKYVSRPRGTSDARWRTAIDTGPSNTNYNYNARSAPSPLFFSPKPRLMPDQAALSDSDDHSASRQRHNRGVSVVSVSTENEIHAMAELLDGSVISRDTSRSQSRNSDTTYNPQSDDDSADEAVISRPYRQYASPRRRVDSSSTYSDGDSVDQQQYHGAPYSAFHLPRPRLGQVYTSDGESRGGYTPSLVSSASYSSLSSSSRSNPMSPSTPSSGFGHELPAGYPLTIIQEDHDGTRRVYGDLGSQNHYDRVVGSQESLDLISSPPPKSSATSQSTTTLKTSGTERFHSSSPAPFLLRTVDNGKRSVDTVRERIESVGSSSPKMGSFSRSQPNKGDTVRDRTESTGSTSPSTGAFSRLLSNKSLVSTPIQLLDPKAAKAELKKQKKEESKARKEKLAHDLKERSKKAAADRASLNSSERKKKEAVVSMFGTADAFTM
ncbi:hypothetical protein C8J56DRAFT_911415 [Mycena floridula]|nr:hypothetical protein C8J56DRAFT_911415 [Mycena floridula]